MRRRAWIQSMIAAIPFSGVRAWAQTASFPGAREGALKELAATVLPAALGRAGTDAIAAQFARWVREYRAGAEMQSGYGFTRVRYKGASPAPRYLEQLDQLASGALAEHDVAARREKIAEALRAANVKDLSSIPDGNHVASDLMTFYFQSPEANDLAYGASIGRDQCRTLKDSSSVPAPLKGGTGAAL
jgi:hypothetical protein